MSNDLATRFLDAGNYKIDVSSWIYLESSFPKERLFTNIRIIQNNESVLLDNDITQSFGYLEAIEKQLLMVDFNEQENLTSLFSAMKWLNKAWIASEDNDKIINWMIALEFAIANEKDSPLLETNTLKIIRVGLHEIIQKHMQEADETTVNKLCNKFAESCTSTPLMVKLRSLIERLSIPITEEQINLIDMARKKRNLLMHGKEDVSISREDLRLICQIVSTIIQYRLKEEREKA